MTPHQVARHTVAEDCGDAAAGDAADRVFFQGSEVGTRCPQLFDSGREVSEIRIRLPCFLHGGRVGALIKEPLVEFRQLRWFCGASHSGLVYKGLGC